MVLIEKHFTSTAFVLHPIEDKVLLHWHSKVKAWLPPGGHIENNETPVEAVKRETFEEAGIHIKLYNFNSSISEIPFSDVKEIPAPYTILLENINDPENGEHIHIDMIYFSEALKIGDLKDGWFWVNENDLKGNVNLNFDNSNNARIHDDVKYFGLKCIELRRKYGN